MSLPDIDVCYSYTQEPSTSPYESENEYVTATEMPNYTPTSRDSPKMLVPLIQAAPNLENESAKRDANNLAFDEDPSAEKPKKESIDFFPVFLSIFFPLAGMIFYCVYTKLRPRLAKMCIISSITSIIAYVSLFLYQTF